MLTDDEREAMVDMLVEILNAFRFADEQVEIINPKNTVH